MRFTTAWNTITRPRVEAVTSDPEEYHGFRSRPAVVAAGHSAADHHSAGAVLALIALFWR
jgi:hypothetical protein